MMRYLQLINLAHRFTFFYKILVIVMEFNHVSGTTPARVPPSEELPSSSSVDEQMFANMISAQPKLLVTLVRHGETFLNVQRVMQGHSDACLSQIGMEQATKLGKYLNGKVKFVKAYSSDLQRAYNTANLILNEACSTSPTLMKDVKLRERCYGDAEGKPFLEFVERAEKANLSISEFIPAGAESPEELRQRVAEFFDKLCELSDNTNTTEDNNVLVVSHGGWIQSLMRHLNGSPGKYKLKNFSPSEAIRIHHNTAVTVMRVSTVSEQTNGLKYEIEFVKINNTDHLKSE